MTWYYWVVFGLMVVAMLFQAYAAEQARKAREAYKKMEMEASVSVGVAKSLAETYRTYLLNALNLKGTLWCEKCVEGKDYTRKEQDDHSDHLD